jgi:hypothetical protein
MTGSAGRDNAGHDSSGQNAAGQDRPGSGGPESRARVIPDLPDARKLAQDWVTLWQSELSAMAADREMREAWQTILAVWAGTMSAMLRGLPRAPAPQWHSNPAADRHEIERLARHVATLERRLADLERAGDPPVTPKRSPGRKTRK